MELKGEIGKIEIEVLAQKSSGTGQFWEENWLYCTIKGTFPGFSAKYDCNLRTDDFQRCKDEIYALKNGNISVARFNTIEEVLDLKFENQNNELIRVSGLLKAIDFTNCSLQFNFEIDNFNLDRFLNDIIETIDMYPIIGDQ
jgi:hypothetical protein